MSNPKCPITGEPAVRLVQPIKSRFLVDLWRYSVGVDARPSFGGIARFDLWQSPTGLYFFDPMVEGDHEFYTSFYNRLQKRRQWSEESMRCEFHLAARDIKPNDLVLDVGCGLGNFRHAVPHARYVGLDPHFAQRGGVANVHRQTLREHLADHAGAYDAVCAFEVLEHVTAPGDLFADMVRAARPSGLVVVGVPHVPSALTRIPNLVINAPPHHLSWWTKPALEALAQRNGASVERIVHVPWGKEDALLYWMERCSLIRCRDVHYRNRVSWHAAACIGYCAGRLLHALRKTPATTDEGGGLLLVARRRP
jgi:SAM-dependent methyltransferase